MDRNPVSSGLDHDARAALHRFRLEAGAFGTISHTLAGAAHAATTAYAAALGNPDDEHWRELVIATASLVRQARSFRDLIGLEPSEAAALAFFERVVDENADLLESSGPAPTDAAYRYRVWAAGVPTAAMRRKRCVALT